METVSIFSCKDLSPKKCLALQILGYTTISILSEKFEPDSRVRMESFAASGEQQQQQQQQQHPQQPQSQQPNHTPLQEMVESVNICSAIWEKVSDAAPPSNILFPKLLELDARIQTRGDLDVFIEETVKIQDDIPDTFRILTDIFTNECLSEERVCAIVEALKLAQQQQQPPQKHNSGRSKTLRVHGRRAITPIRSRHNHKRVPTNSV